LGLLKAAVIASGIIPPGLEGQAVTLGELLSRVVGAGAWAGNRQQREQPPKGSRLAFQPTCWDH